MLFQLLGWKYDTEGPKADVFSDSVSALGVLFDLSRTHQEVVVIDNTCKRKEDLDKMVADILGLVLELRGKLAFADAQVMGLAGRFALQQITAHAYHSPFKARLSYECSTTLKFLRKRIAEATPRSLRPSKTVGCCLRMQASTKTGLAAWVEFLYLLWVPLGPGLVCPWMHPMLRLCCPCVASTL